LKEALEEAVRSRDAVLSVVAHDLRNPLNVIALATGNLLIGVQEPSLRRSVERIMRSAQRADRMIRDLLTIGELETGRFVIDTGPVETAELILSAVESQYTLAAAASVIVAPDLSPELPPMEADEDRLMDVLENLIGNAIKFTAPGGSITVGASHDDSQITIWVKDSGSGIAPEQLPYIFDRFWQAKKKERRGIGLGLSICKRTVEAHGGTIWAESTLGVGTTLFFTVPQAMRRQGAREPSDVANVLLVDDRPENLLALQAILEGPEYRLVTAKSGPEALALVLRERFAVALVDIAMPGMTGLEVASHLKDLDRSRDIPIIFVTAFGDDPQEIHRAYSAGGVDYLVKPLDPEIVRKKVAVFVDLSRRQRRSERT
jgi:CheY-like chemotaxis protein